MKGLILAILLSVLVPGSLLGSDHIDGPVTTRHGISDVTDLFAFPTPNTPGSLTLILNAHPFATPDRRLPERIRYTFVIRKIDIASSGARPAFQTGDEVRLSCHFEAPSGSSRGSVVCNSGSGLRANAQVDAPASKGDFRLFAGLRSDPFFFNSKWALSTSMKGALLRPQKGNTMTSLNVWSIVIDIDASKLFSTSLPSLLAVTAITTTQDDAAAPVRQLDRIGRPEITNLTMVAHGAPDLRDRFNQEPPFAATTGAVDYRTRLRDNITRYDQIDGKLEWPETHKADLVNLLLDDFLVVDVGKPSRSDAFFEIERALLDGRSHETCGGRRPTDDIMDAWFTYYINRGLGPEARDGVDRPERLISDRFPYLARPSSGLWTKMKATLTRWYFKQ